MFLFRWFHVFEEPYWNGFCDGVSIGSVFWVLVALLRIHFVWTRQADDLRHAVRDLMNAAECRAVSRPDVVEFRALIQSHEFIEPAEKVGLLSACDGMIAALESRTRGSMRELGKHLVFVNDWINTAEFRPFRAFLRHPLRNARYILLRFFGC